MLKGYGDAVYLGHLIFPVHQHMDQWSYHKLFNMVSANIY